MHFQIGEVRAHNDSEVRHIRHSEETRTLRPGDIVETFGHVFEWDQDCVPIELCESWRGVGDPLCDDALRQAFAGPSSSVGKDLLQTLEQRADIQDDQSEAIRTFVDEIHQAPPSGIMATEEEVALAQAFFLDNSIQIMQALLHYSLAGGFASPRIVRTLAAVSYLVPHVRREDEGSSSHDLSHLLNSISKASSDRTLSRLLETFQFVLDVMGCSAPAAPAHPIREENIKLSQECAHTSSQTHVSGTSELAYLLPGGEGWKSTARVRLLHGVARWRAEERWKREGQTRSVEAGVPISQEDLAATLAAFSTIPIWCLHRLHLPPTQEQASAYLALWRHVGYYLGVSPKILLRYFSNTRTADKFLATAALHLFSDELTPSPSPPPSSSPSPSESRSTILRGPTIPILVAVSNRPPLNTSLEYNIALTTHLLGTPLSAHLGLPRTSLRARLSMHAFLLVQRIPHVFASWYPRRAWLEKRRAVLREGLMRSVRWNLGLRRTTFRPRTMVQDVGLEGEAGGGELAPGVVEEEGVKPDPARAKVLTKMWSEVWMEMVGVCVATFAVTGVVGYVGLGYLLNLARSWNRAY
ncbi:hypothetical protein BV20DRAFT_203668 [Pilatotrama ljubarskyi]|nr:hypothetical protein BV20DRAFT_203668 [Pilatotrama ljubarskyi]